MLRVGVALHDGARAATQAVDVALSPALRHEPPARAQQDAQARKQALVVRDPVKRRGRQDRVDGFGQLELQQVVAQQLEPAVARAQRSLEPSRGGLEHRRRRVHGDHPAARQALQQCLRDPPGAAPRVDHGLVAAQLEAG